MSKTAISPVAVKEILDTSFAYYGVNNSDGRDAKFASAFTALNGSGKYKTYKAYPVMLLFAGATFTGTFTGTFNVSDGGIRFAVSDETRMYQGVFNRSTNTLASIYSPSDQITTLSEPVATSNTTTTITANAVTVVEINVAKTGKKAIAICGVIPYYPNVMEIRRFELSVANQKVTLSIRNTSSTNYTGATVQCLYVNA